MLRTLLTHSVIYGATTMVTRGAALLLLLVLPHFMSPADYGALAMIMAVSVLVLFVVPLEVLHGLARYFPAAKEDEKHGYAASSWWFTLAALTAFVIVGEVFAEPLNRLILGDPAYLPVFRLALPLIAANGLFYLVQSQFRWEFRPWGFTAVSLVMAAGTMTLAVGLAVTMDDALRGAIIGQLIGYSAAVVLALALLRQSLLGPPDRNKLGQMLAFSLPLVPASVALFVSQYASRLMLNGMSNLEDVGIFTFGSQIAAIATLAVLGVQASLIPLVVAHHEEPGTPVVVARAFEGFTGLALCLCLLLGLFSAEAIAWFGDPAYAGAAPLVLVLAPALVMMGMYIFAPGFLIAKKTTWQLGVSLVGAAVCVIANYVMIGWGGIMGAAFAALLAAAVLLILWFALSQRLYPVPIRWSRVATGVAAAAAAGVASLYVDGPGTFAAIGIKLGLLLLAATVFVLVDLLPLGPAVRVLKGKLAGPRA